MTGLSNRRKLYYLRGINWILIYRYLFIASLSRAVSHQSLTAEARIQSQVSPSEICGEQSATATGFSPSASVFLCQYHPTNASYSSSCTCCSHQKDKEAKPAKLPKKERSFVNREHWTEKYFHFFIVSLKHCNLIAQKSCILRTSLDSCRHQGCEDMDTAVV